MRPNVRGSLVEFRASVPNFPFRWILRHGSFWTNEKLPLSTQISIVENLISLAEKIISARNSDIFFSVVVEVEQFVRKR